MEPFELLLQYVATVCDRLEIRYLTVGSMATIAFGEPRFTSDIHIVIDLRLNDVSVRPPLRLRSAIDFNSISFTPLLG